MSSLRIVPNTADNTSHPLLLLYQFLHHASIFDMVRLSNAICVVEDIYGCTGELACRNAAFEQEVEFGEGATLRLRDSEVGVDYAEETDSGLIGPSCQYLQEE